jgi:hypothetical protein
MDTMDGSARQKNMDDGSTRGEIREKRHRAKSPQLKSPPSLPTIRVGLGSVEFGRARWDLEEKKKSSKQG